MAGVSAGGGAVGGEPVGGGLGFGGDGPQDRWLGSEHPAPVGEVAGVVGAGDAVDADEGAGEGGAELGDEFFRRVGVVPEPFAVGAGQAGWVSGPVGEFLTAPSRR